MIKENKQKIYIPFINIKCRVLKEEPNTFYANQIAQVKTHAVAK
jgi:hypothetical protein